MADQPSSKKPLRLPAEYTRTAGGKRRLRAPAGLHWGSWEHLRDSGMTWDQLRQSGVTWDQLRQSGVTWDQLAEEGREGPPALAGQAARHRRPGAVRHRGVEVVAGIWLLPMGLTDEQLREDCREAARLVTTRRRAPSIAAIFSRRRSRHYDPKTVRKMIAAGRVLLGKK